MTAVSPIELDKQLKGDILLDFVGKSRLTGLLDKVPLKSPFVPLKLIFA